MFMHTRKIIAAVLTILFCTCTLVTAQNRYGKIKIGITWAKKSTMQDTISGSLQKELEAIAPEIEIELQTALPDMETFKATVQRFDKEKDALVVLRSPCVSYLKEYKTSIPTFIGGCNNPAYLGVVKNLEHPEGNITGVTYYLKKDTQVKVFKTIIPKMKNLMLLLEKNHPSSAIERNDTLQACKKLNIKYFESVCSSKKELIDTVKSNKDKVDAFVIGTQAITIDNSQAIIEAAGNTPVLAYSEKPIKEGALCGFSANDFKLGIILAKTIKNVLIDGKAIREIPVQEDSQPQLFLNLKTAQRLNIQIPLEVLEVASFKE